MEGFPNEAPFIKLRNPVFHQLIDSTGTLKYFPTQLHHEPLWNMKLSCFGSFNTIYPWRMEGGSSLNQLLVEIHKSFKDVPRSSSKQESDLERAMVSLDAVALDALLNVNVPISEGFSPEVKIMESPEYKKILKSIRESIACGKEILQKTIANAEEIEQEKNRSEVLLIQVQELNEKFLSKLERCNVIQQVNQKKPTSSSRNESPMIDPLDCLCRKCPQNGQARRIYKMHFW